MSPGIRKPDMVLPLKGEYHEERTQVSRTQKSAGAASASDDGAHVGILRKKSNVKAGRIYAFCAYEQDNDLSDSREPIEWIVLRREKDRCLLIREQVLDASHYNVSAADVTWGTCGERYFPEETFTAEDPDRENSADRDPKFDTDPGRRPGTGYSFSAWMKRTSILTAMNRENSL